MRVAEELLAESLEEKTGTVHNGCYKADRELEVAVREGIITFFHDHDSDKATPDIHKEVSESISSWRKPSLIEFEAILDSSCKPSMQKKLVSSNTNTRRN